MNIFHVYQVLQVSLIDYDSTSVISLAVTTIRRLLVVRRNSHFTLVSYYYNIQICRKLQAA